MRTPLFRLLLASRLAAGPLFAVAAEPSRSAPEPGAREPLSLPAPPLIAPDELDPGTVQPRRVKSGLRIAADPGPGGVPQLAELEASAESACAADAKADACRYARLLLPELRALCRSWPPECEGKRELAAGALGLHAALRRCSGSPCPPEELRRMAERQSALGARSLEAGEPIWIFSLFNSARPGMARLLPAAVDAEQRDLGARLAGLEARTRKLEAGALASSASGEIEALGSEGYAAFTEFQTVSALLDHLGHLTEGKERPAVVEERRRAANRTAWKLGELRDRLILLQGRAGTERAERFSLDGLVDPAVESQDRLRDEAEKLARNNVSGPRAGLLADPFGRGAEPPPGGPAAVPASGPGEAGPGPGAHPLVNAQPRKTLLDIPGSVARAPPGPPKPPPPIVPGASLWSAAKALAGFGDERRRADAMRRLGLSRTIGDPGRRAAFVHAQGDATCAVVSQQQVLRAHGMLDGKDPKAEEAALRDEAERKGYFQHGTPPDYQGSILVDRGLIVTKHEKASLAKLDASIAAGRMPVVNVDARYLWNMRDFDRPLGHAIVLTGAEVSRAGGEVLGYYYNDSGDDPPRGGGFITREDFEKAFEQRGRRFVEVR